MYNIHTCQIYTHYSRRAFICLEQIIMLVISTYIFRYSVISRERLFKTLSHRMFRRNQLFSTVSNRHVFFFLSKQF